MVVTCQMGAISTNLRVCLSSEKSVGPWVDQKRSLPRKRVDSQNYGRVHRLILRTVSSFLFPYYFPCATLKNVDWRPVPAFLDCKTAPSVVVAGLPSPESVYVPREEVKIISGDSAEVAIAVTQSR